MPSDPSAQISQRKLRFAGIIAGIVIMSCGFFMQAVSAVFVVIVIAALIAFLPYIYSFRLYNTDKG